MNAEFLRQLFPKQPDANGMSVPSPEIGERNRECDPFDYGTFIQP